MLVTRIVSGSNSIRLPDAVGNVAEEDDFGEWAGVVEVATGLATALGGFDPLAMMAG
jgi:hypothetical protein